MLNKTSGIILHTTKYAESSLIVKIYTLHFGLQSYIISIGRSKKSKNKISVFQPLTLVELVSKGNPKNSLQRISEITITQPYNHIPYDIIKSSMVIFLNEVLVKCLKESQPDEELFGFLKNSLLILDIYEGNCANFHISFMMQLSRFFGFYPQGKFSDETPLLDLREGGFTGSMPSHSFYLEKKQAESFSVLLFSGYDTLKDLKIDNINRRNVLNALILLYQIHVDSFGTLKSKEILEEIIK
jgi:DNA repair protein RecO (recombination protein O)